MTIASRGAGQDGRPSISQDGRPPIHDCHILVVDDTDFNRALIGALLTDAGFTNVAFAVNGVEALDMIACHKPDLVILDIMMPKMDGFEVCRRLRADHAYADLPVLVQTALSGSEDRNRAFSVGTTDLVSKPIDRAELLARVRIHLENRILIRDLQAYRDRLESELAMARSMYDHLLPSAGTITRLKEQSGLELLSHTLLSSELGGDIWGVQDLGGGKAGIYLLDLSGRGVSAALNAFRMHTLIHELVPGAVDPAAFLSELSDRAKELLALGDHAAMVYGVADSGACTFTYAAAAACNPLIVGPDGAVRPAGTIGGLPLGVTLGARYESVQVRFEPGSAFMLHSNAVRDTLNAGNDQSVEGGASAVFAAVIAQVLGQAGQTGAGSVEAFRQVTQALADKLGESPEEDHTVVWLSHAGA